MKAPTDSLGWTLLNDAEKALLAEYGFKVITSAIGSEIAALLFVNEHKKRIEQGQAWHSRVILDAVLFAHEGKRDHEYATSLIGKGLPPMRIYLGVARYVDLKTRRAEVAAWPKYPVL